VGDTGIWHHCWIDASPFFTSVLAPEKGDWLALEDDEEQIEEGEADYCS
jgi:hypothetical protein